ncbi:MAG: sulfotransferase [Alphaproteobacteria bacterium]|nr:sulfotransferase [Alphaproteobacteria bacterium]
MSPLPPTAPATWPPDRYRADVAAFDRLMRWFGPHIPALSLRSEDILVNAERAEGCCHWGEGGALDAMRLLSDDLQAEPPSGIGRLMASQVLLTAARLRLRMNRLLEEGRLPDRQPNRPWIVCGLHRSGTTWMQRLLCAVPGRRGVPNHHLITPLPAPGRVWRARAVLGFSRWVSPEMWSLHPVWPTVPDECWTLCTPSFRIYDIALHWHLPRYIAWLDQTDMRPAYRTYRILLANIEAELGGGPLTLKGPCHIAGLGALLEEMPDARVIWTHRDPAETVASFGRLTALQRRTIYGSYDPVRAGAATVHRAANAVRRGLEGLGVDPSRVVHVRYTDLVADPLGVVEAICERLEEPLSAAGRADLSRLIAAKGGQRMGDDRYAPAAWGLTAEAIRAAMPAYVARFTAPGAPMR